MSFMRKIASYFSGQAKSLVFSLLGGSILILFWLSLEQIKTEPQLPFWDITYLAKTNITQSPQPIPAQKPLTLPIMSTPARG